MNYTIKHNTSCIETTHTKHNNFCIETTHNKHKYSCIEVRLIDAARNSDVEEIWTATSEVIIPIELATTRKVPYLFNYLIEQIKII